MNGSRGLAVFAGALIFAASACIEDAATFDEAAAGSSGSHAIAGAGGTEGGGGGGASPAGGKGATGGAAATGGAVGIGGGGGATSGGAGGGSAGKAGGTGGTGACTPTTCDAQGKNCDTIPDGCNGTLSCGACTAPELCGVGAKPNVCALPCPEGCPTGYACSSKGACAGGNPAAINLDVRTVAASGTVTLNGAAPTSCSTGTSVIVKLTETTYGYTFTQYVPCGSTAWTLTVFPGTYKAEVQGSSSNVPTTWFVANPTLALTAPQANIDLDVKTVTASGTVTLNGAAPTSCSTGTSVIVKLTETTYGYTFTQYVPCGSTAWTLTVFPGTYKAEVQGSSSNVPTTWFVANPTLALTAPQANINLDVKTVTASGTVTLNGAAPTSCSTGTSVIVKLTETTYGYTFTQYVPCGSTAWTLTVFPGTYKAEVQGSSSNVPTTWFVANPTLALTAPQANINLDVKTVTASGTVTLNGAAPTSCSTGTSVIVKLTETTYGYTFTQYVPCGSTAWTLTVFPGTYKAEVQGSSSNVPATWYVAIDKIVLP